MQKKILKMLFVSLSACLISCGTIPDKPVCTDLRFDAGFCVWTISNKEMVVDDHNLLDGKTWYDMQVGIIKMPLDTFLEIKKYIINQCKRNNNCSQSIDSWDRAMDTLEMKAKGGSK